MVEAVGQQHLGVYMHSIARLLKPGGRAVIQVCSPACLAGKLHACRLQAVTACPHCFTGCCSSIARLLKPRGRAVIKVCLFARLAGEPHACSL